MTPPLLDWRFPRAHAVAYGPAARITLEAPALDTPPLNIFETVPLTRRASVFLEGIVISSPAFCTTDISRSDK